MKSNKQISSGRLIHDLITQREKLYKLESQVRENLSYLLNHELLSAEGLSNISLLEQVLQAGLWFYLPDSDEVFLTGPIRAVTGVSFENEPVPWEVFEKAIHGEDRLMVKAQIDRLWNHSGLLETDFRILKETGGPRENRILHLRAFRANNKKQPAFIIGSLQDVTENRKILEDLLRDREKAVESDHLKTIFLSNLSHEFRNPMNAIIGFSELINSGNIDTEKRKEYARIITRKGNHILSLIDDIAELAKFEIGKVSVNKKNCDVNRIAGELFLQFQDIKKQIQKDHIEFLLYKVFTIFNR